MQVSFSLDKKLILLVMTVSVVALSITAYLSFNYADQILKERIGDQLISESTIRGDSVSFLLETRIKETQILSTDPMIQILVQELNEKKNSPEFEKIVDEKRRDFLTQIQAFQNLVGFSIGFEDVKIIGNDGSVYFSLVRLGDKNYSNDPWFLDGMNNKELAEFIPKDRDKKLMVVTPIYKQDDKHGDNPIGVIIAQMRTKFIDDIFLNRSSLGRTGEVYLVNDDRLMITESRFVENAVFNQKVETVPVEKCFRFGSNYVGFYLDYRGVPIYGSSYCAKELGFVLLAEINESEIIESITILQNRIFQTGLIITAIMGIVAFILSKSLSKPLIKLKKAANQIAQGNFDVRTNIHTKDEIGELSHSFDLMAKKLQESLFEIKAKEDVIKQQEEILLNFSDRSEVNCVCLIDIKDSTKVTSNLSDEETGKLYSIFLNYMANLVRKYDGTVIKNIGDALLFCFHKMENADKQRFQNVLECCLTMTESHGIINERLEREGLPKVDYKVSSTYGSVRVAKVTKSEVDDIFGTTVNRCAKINPFAPNNGFVIGEALYDMVKTFSGYTFNKIHEELPNIHGYSIFHVTRNK